MKILVSRKLVEYGDEVLFKIKQKKKGKKNVKNLPWYILIYHMNYTYFDEYFEQMLLLQKLLNV